MPLSLMLTSLPLGFAEALRQAVALGFECVDVVALADRPEVHLQALADSGLVVRCAAVGRDLPEGETPDAADRGPRRRALETMKRQVADAARLGATYCYVVPGQDAAEAGLARFAETCTLLADHAAGRMVRLCVEHFPGKALPDVRAVLSWLERAGHPNLALLLDVGHCQISGEDPVAAIRAAGPRLGYVHFDDNDGVRDCHWPLLAGRLTEEKLAAIVAALVGGGYEGAVALELNPHNPDPVGGVRQGRELLARHCRPSQPGEQGGPPRRP